MQQTEAMIDKKPVEHGKLWGGRFASAPAATLDELNNSLSIDKRLWREDIEASRAWVQALLRADVLTREESQQLDRGLLAVQERLAEALGKSRSHVANLLRLLALPDDVLGLVREGRLTAGHARALITTANPSELAQQVLKGDLSVRETERLTTSKPRLKRRPAAVNGAKDADTAALERDLGAALQMSVSIAHDVGAEGGTLSIRYRTLDQLDELCRRLNAEA